MKQWKGLGRIFAFTFRQQTCSGGYRRLTAVLAALCFLVPAIVLGVMAARAGNEPAAVPEYIPEDLWEPPVCHADSVLIHDETEAPITDWSFLQALHPESWAVTYTADEKGISQKYVITNTDTKNMPYTFCLHSTFVEPESFVMPVSARQEHNEIDIPTGRFVELNAEEQLYSTGAPSKDKSVCGYYVLSGHTARIGDILYTVSDNFDHWITYNARGKAGFICIEPQAGLVNGLNIEGGARILAPGESAVYTTRYTHV